MYNDSFLFFFFNKSISLSVSYLTVRPRNSSTLLNKAVRAETLALFPVIGGKHSVLRVSTMQVLGFYQFKEVCFIICLPSLAFCFMNGTFLHLLKWSACNAGDRGSIPVSGRSPEDPLQYSCLENPTDRGAWWVTIHEVTKVRHDLQLNHRNTVLSV